MDPISRGIERMSDYAPGTDYIPQTGYTKRIITLGDVYEYLSNVFDMGAGVMTIDVTLPEGLTKENIMRIFKKGPVCREVASSPSDISYNALSIGHLGGDECFFAMVHCGADAKDKYRLIVSSYDEHSARVFREDICASVQRALSSNINRKEVLCKPVDMRTILNSMVSYKNAIANGLLNRRAVAAAILRELGIRVATERAVLAGGASMDVVTNDAYTWDHQCTFLSDEHGGVRLYCRAYHSDELLIGAPWCASKEVGFYSYERTPRVNVGDVPVPHGMPMGATAPDYALRARTCQPDIAEQIRAKITWNTDLDVLLVVDPGDEVEYTSARNALEDTYNVRTMRNYLWRTVAMYMAPPTIYKIPLDAIVHYTQQSTVTLHYEQFRLITDMWVTVRDYYHHKRILPPQAALPPMAKFFVERAQTEDGKYVSVEKVHLVALIKQHRMAAAQSAERERPLRPPPAQSSRTGMQEVARENAHVKAPTAPRHQPSPVNDRIDHRDVMHSTSNPPERTRRPPRHTRTKSRRPAERTAYATESESDVHCSGDETLRAPYTNGL